LTTCPTCLEQIVIGIAGQASKQTCMYNAIPGLTGATNTAAFILTAPATPGIYYISANTDLQSNCTGALTGVPPSTPGNYIGTLTVF